MAKCIDYLEGVFDPKKLSGIVNRIVSTLRPLQYDAIAMSGMSGALVGSIVANRLGKPMMLVRKPHEEKFSHSRQKIESGVQHNRPICYVIIDDLISSGDTINRIRYAIENENVNSTCIAIVLYAQESEPRTKYNCIPIRYV
jgi:adenine/guanine phosphoribosyltransferase-like PRPP-binding protein